MANAHRTNVLVTSCLKTPVDPRTRARLASYERERALPCAASCRRDHRHREEELEYEDSDSDSCDEGRVAKGGALAAAAAADYRAAGGDRLDLSEIFFSNEEYYSKLEELKKAHLRTMAELEGMYRHKLQLGASAPLDATRREAGGDRLPWSSCSPAAPRRLQKCRSAVELRRSSGASDSSDGADAVPNGAEPGSPFSPREHIKNMWRDFQLSPRLHRPSSSSVRSLPTGRGTPRRAEGRRRRQREDGEQEEEEEEEELWRHRLTVPKPFQMTLREAERRRRGVKSRAQIEHENAALRRQLEELTECQKKFRAGAVPAHVHLPLYEELQERRRRREDRRPRPAQKPFSFLERERLKKEQKQPAAAAAAPGEQEAVKPFKAKPVPKAVYAAASGEQMKEEQLYRSIKMQMRAQEMLHSAAMPPGMLARRLGERKKTGGEAAAAAAASGDDSFSHRPHINAEVPDHDASYRRFRRHLERQKGTKPTTACEPFQLRTARIASHRERLLADVEAERASRPLRLHVGPAPLRRATSSRCSSLSGSLELLPTKVTGASRKREEAVRKVLQERKKAEEEEERWKERQRRREKKLQRVVQKRAQAHDPHLALAQTQPAKLQEFRNQELQRKKEYSLEIREMRQRVKGRPLLLEQVAQRNAKQAAEKRFADAVRGCDLTEEFISSAAGDRRHSDEEEPDPGYGPLHYRKVFLDGGGGSPEERGGGGGGGSGAASPSRQGDAAASRHSDDSYRYSDDHEEYSDDSEQEEEREAGK